MNPKAKSRAGIAAHPTEQDAGFLLVRLLFKPHDVSCLCDECLLLCLARLSFCFVLLCSLGHRENLAHDM